MAKAGRPAIGRIERATFEIRIATGSDVDASGGNAKIDQKEICETINFLCLTMFCESAR